jgi:ElaB/YqjD/DUF883 family membrane-anchored ribosome-binding protein
MSLPLDLPLNPDELATQAREAVRKVGDHLHEHANYLRETAGSARYHSEDFIQNNPWPAIGIAAGVGFLLGLIVARR